MSIGEADLNAFLWCQLYTCKWTSQNGQCVLLLKKCVMPDETYSLYRRCRLENRLLNLLNQALTEFVNGAECVRSAEAAGRTDSELLEGHTVLRAECDAQANSMLELRSGELPLGTISGVLPEIEDIVEHLIPPNPAIMQGQTLPQFFDTYKQKTCNY